MNGCFLEAGIVGQKSEPFGDGRIGFGAQVDASLVEKGKLVQIDWSRISDKI